MDRRLHRAAAGERGSPFTTAGWRKMVARLGVAAKLGFKAQPHMFGTLAAFSLRTRAPTRAPCRRTSAIETSSTPCATPNCRPRASRTSGAISLVSTSRRTSAHSAASTADGLPFDLQHQRQAPEKALAGGQCSIYALANDELTVNAPSIGQPIDLAGLVSAEYLRHTNRAPRSPIG